MTEAAAALADEIGLAQLSMSVVAERLGVKAPSLYKHVDGLPDLVRRVAVLAATELGDALRDAMQGRAGRDALEAMALMVRRYVQEHPGRYSATLGVRRGADDDPLTAAMDRTLASFAAALRGYALDPADEVHALRVIRSTVHGFATLEASDGFQMATDVDASFAWLIAFLDHGLRASRSEDDVRGRRLGP
ncbi:TetR-like C-terminal domain-containing protein [Curtobacterium sp. ISL-83]|uniref:TetR-like C-terminal domain-containing protein n=1 Tax=Curtobacterium sp. ISL-83 TaxID=2819145 RepID=UPI0027DF41A0|nr:TetR-like C-terminal domain-containing protein [Curtobacterium sp. ISL-83]